MHVAATLEIEDRSLAMALLLSLQYILHSYSLVNFLGDHDGQRLDGYHWIDSQGGG